MLNISSRSLVTNIHPQTQIQRWTSPVSSDEQWWTVYRPVLGVGRDISNSWWSTLNTTSEGASPVSDLATSVRANHLP